MVSCSAFQLRLAAWAATESIKVSHAVLLEHMSFLQTLCVCVCVFESLDCQELGWPQGLEALRRGSFKQRPRGDSEKAVSRCWREHCGFVLRLTRVRERDVMQQSFTGYSPRQEWEEPRFLFIVRRVGPTGARQGRRVTAIDQKEPVAMLVALGSNCRSQWSSLGQSQKKRKKKNKNRWTVA